MQLERGGSTIRDFKNISGFEQSGDFKRVLRYINRADLNCKDS